MTKDSEINLSLLASQLAKARETKHYAEETIRTCETAFRNMFAKEGVREFKFDNGYTVSLGATPDEKRIPSWRKMKADGVLEKYSRTEDGTEEIVVKNPDNEFLEMERRRVRKEAAPKKTDKQDNG